VLLLDIDGTLVDSTGAVERSGTSWSRKRGVDLDQVLHACH
jgi:sugar-phosphatase